jgi:hypothetical protein
MTTPTRATSAGRAYLDPRKKARRDRRPVDELMHFYVLECFLDRLTATRFADTFVLKGLRPARRVRGAAPDPRR